MLNMEDFLDFLKVISISVMCIHPWFGMLAFNVTQKRQFYSFKNSRVLYKKLSKFAG